jgi:HEPN domain-containing protein
MRGGKRRRCCGCNCRHPLLFSFVMDAERVKGFWIEEAAEALRVAWHLYEKEDYSYALFFGHLAIEKLLKAIYVFRKAEQAPYLHNLLRLAEAVDLSLSEERKAQFIRITGFNLEARYPDEKRTFRQKCTLTFAENQLREIEEAYQWLMSILQ